MDARLSRSDWIEHGLRTLARQGAAGLRVAPLAVALGVSRGSFYWHFRDLADFRLNVLRRWEEQTTELVIRALEAGAARPERLRRLLRRAFSSKPGGSPGAVPWAAEDRIRAWAIEDADVATAVAAIDSRRIAYIETLLVHAGVAVDPSRSRATFLYWAYLGRASLAEGRRPALGVSALDDIVALFER